MRKLILIFSISVLITSNFSCKKFLDINSDPDTPQAPNPSSIMPAMLAGIPRGIQFDGRFLGRYTQMFHINSANDLWDGMGYNANSDNGGDIFRQAYYGLGRNLEYMITEAKQNKQWDYVGAAQALKAYIFQALTLTHGEVGFDGLYADNQYFYKYQSQQRVLEGIDTLCRDALVNLARTDLSATQARLSVGDYVYNGNTALWIKFVNGLLARNYLSIIHKSPTYADSAIKYAGLAMASGNDDFLVPFDATRNDDANFWGTFRNNLGTTRQSRMIVNLLDGTTFTGTNTPFNRDPRMQHMLSCSQDTTTTNTNGGYRGLLPGAGDPNTATVNPRQRIPVLWGDSLHANPGASNFGLPQGKFLFHNKSVMPVMTYAEMQFIKAEAELRKGLNTNAYTSYRNGINAHFDFINRTSYPRSNVPLFKVVQISAVERARYFASTNVKAAATNLNFSDIMLQKYIALWGWGFVETWTDMRRYHYTDLDPLTGTPVYSPFGLGFQPLSSMLADNGGKPANRLRPRFNSEVVWNIESINEMITAATSYNTYPINYTNLHTAECWFSRP
jgi:hypothetical protein